MIAIVIADCSFSSRLTQQKLASVIAYVASLDFPVQWDDLLEIFSLKVKQTPVQSALVFFGVIQQLSDDSQEATSKLPPKRRREILQAIEVIHRCFTHALPPRWSNK